MLFAISSCGDSGSDNNTNNTNNTNNGTCGNGMIDVGEECDGTNLGGATCSDFGSTGGTILGCNSDCTVNLDGCDGYAWAKHAGGAGEDKGIGITVDSAGNIYFTGNFQGIATFDSTTLTSSGDSDIFVAKFNHLFLP